MLYYELKKLWQRPLVVITCCCVCLFHIATIVSNQLIPYEAQSAAIYERYEGKLDETWKQSIRNEYAVFMQDSNHFNSKQELEKAGYTAKQIEQMDLWDERNLKNEVLASPTYAVLSEAYRASFVEEQIQTVIDQKRAQYAQQYPNMELSQVNKAYEQWLNQYDQLSFGNHMGYTLLLGSMTYHIRSLCLLLIVLLSTMFTNEQASGVLELQLVCKLQHKLNVKKLMAAMLSAGMVWGGLMLVEVITVAYSIGFRGEDGIIQDFSFHTGPYAWTVLGYTLAICLMSFCATVVLGACLCGISSIVKKNSTAFIACFVLFLLPPFFNHDVNDILTNLLYYHPTNMLSANYLFSSYQVNQLGGLYVNRVFIAVVLLVVLLILSYGIIRKRNDQHFLMDIRNGDE